MRLKPRGWRGFTLKFQTSYLQKTLEGLVGKNTIPYFMGLKTISELTVEKYLVQCKCPAYGIYFYVLKLKC